MSSIISSGATQSFLLQGEEARSRQTQIVVYPWDTTTVVGECCSVDESHIPQIEQAAINGFCEFKKTTMAQRAAILNCLADLLEKHSGTLTKLITQEAGKPLRLSKMEVERAIKVCRSYAIEVERMAGLVMSVDGREARIQRFPVGPVLAITPYNFPLNLVVHKLAPAIAAGCSITIKPAPQTPLTALYLGRLAVEAGYDAISVVPASNEVAEQLVRSDVFRKLSFTGSAKVGWHLQSIAGTKSLTLELGGNAALIIEDFTEPVDIIAKRVAFGAFAYAGQVCISVQRIFINERIKEEFMSAFVIETRALTVGDPMRRETDIGPMITMDDVQRARTLIKDALRLGANVVYGGNTFNIFAMNPTILDRTTPEMMVNAEEVFAPIVTVMSYQKFEDALMFANQSKYGLHAGVYTNDLNQAELAYQTLDVGGVMINDIPTYRADILPYGGIKQSGIGREGTMAAIDEYSYIKTLIRK